MGSRPKSEVSAGALAVASYVRRLQQDSGESVDDFAASCGLTHTYWHKRMGGKAPLTLTDCERIAEATGQTLSAFFVHALVGDDADVDEETRKAIEHDMRLMEGRE